MTIFFSAYAVVCVGHSLAHVIKWDFAYGTYLPRKDLEREREQATEDTGERKAPFLMVSA